MLKVKKYSVTLVFLLTLLSRSIIYGAQPRSIYPVLPNLSVSEYPEMIVNPRVAYSYEQMLNDTDRLAEMYPDLISVEEIGKSVEGRKLIAIKLGKGGKEIIMIGSHHAREYISSTYLMKTIDEYAYHYYTNQNFGDYDVRNILNGVSIYYVPMLNPDGVNLVQNGIEAVLDKDKVKSIKLYHNSYRAWKANINGVDLNSQYPAEWEEKKGASVPASEGYKGDKPVSEPEIISIISYTFKHKFLMAATIHTKGETVFWADNNTYGRIPGDRALAEKMAAVTGYKLEPISANPEEYSAGYENWFRLQFLKPAYAVELTPYTGVFPHNDANFDSIVWDKAKYLVIMLADEINKETTMLE